MERRTATARLHASDSPRAKRPARAFVRSPARASVPPTRATARLHASDSPRTLRSRDAARAAVARHASSRAPHTQTVCCVTAPHAVSASTVSSPWRCCFLSAHARTSYFGPGQGVDLLFTESAGWAGPVSGGVCFRCACCVACLQRSRSGFEESHHAKDEVTRFQTWSSFAHSDYKPEFFWIRPMCVPFLCLRVSSVCLLFSFGSALCSCVTPPVQALRIARTRKQQAPPGDARQHRASDCFASLPNALSPPLARAFVLRLRVLCSVGCTWPGTTTVPPHDASTRTHGPLSSGTFLR